MANSYTFRGITLPENLKESIDAFVATGRPTGDFLRACIDNDLMKTMGHGDEISLAALPAIVGYLYNECPARSWGFKGAHDSWVTAKIEERRRA